MADKKIGKTLRKILLEKGFKPSQLEVIAEISYDDFREIVENSIYDLTASARTYIETLNRVEAEKTGKYVYFYKLPTGEVGYFVGEKKTIGYLK